MIKKILNSTTQWAVFFAALLALNFVISFIPAKIDFTEGNLYSLSTGSKNIAGAFDDELTIKFFFSSGNDSLPIMVKNYGKKVGDLLKEFAAQSSYIHLETHNPEPDSDAEEMATKEGVRGVPVGDGQNFYLGVSASYQGNNSEIPFFDPRKESTLEYDIASMLSKLKDDKKKVIGILAGFPVEAPPQAPQSPFSPQQQGKKGEWGFVDELKKLYEVRILKMDIDEIPQDLGILLVLHPTGISEKLEYAIEQFILNDGRAVLVVDPSASTIPDQSNPQMAMYGMSQNTNSNLARIFKMLELEYEINNVLVDEGRATNVNTRQGAVRYPVWISTSKEDFNQDAIATSQLAQMLFAESGFFIPKSDTMFDFKPLVQSTPAAGKVEPMKAQTLIQDPSGYKKIGKQVALAGISTGKYKSTFSEKPKDSKYSRSHIPEAQMNNSVVVIGDVDFLNNRYALDVINFFGQSIIKPKNQNVAFLSNLIEFSAGNPELISIRSRASFARPFTLVRELQNTAQKKWFAQEKALTTKIQDVQRRLNQLQQSKTEGNQLALSSAQRDEVKRFKLEQLSFKRQRRDIRKNLRQDIESLGTVLTIFNIIPVPFLVLLLGLYIYYTRTHSTRILAKEKNNA